MSSRRGSAFGRQEFLSSPIARVMAGVGGTLGGAYAGNVHSRRARERQDAQRQEDKDFQVDMVWAQSGGESQQEQARKAELEAMKDHFDNEDLDAVAASLEQEIPARQEALRRLKPALETQDEIDAVAKEYGREFGSRYVWDDERGGYTERDAETSLVDEGGVAVPIAESARLQELEDQIGGIKPTGVDLHRPDALFPEVDQLAAEIEALESTDAGADVDGFVIPGITRRRARNAQEAELEAKRAEKERFETMQGYTGVDQADLDAAIADAEAGQEWLGRRDELRQPVPRLDQVGQNVRRESALDAQDKAEQEHRKLLERLDAAGYSGLVGTVDGLDRLLPEESLDDARRALGLVQAWRFNTAQQTQLDAADRGDLRVAVNEVRNYESYLHDHRNRQAAENQIAALVADRGGLNNWSLADDRVLLNDFATLTSTSTARPEDLQDALDDFGVKGISVGAIKQLFGGDRAGALPVEDRRAILRAAAAAAEQNRLQFDAGHRNLRAIAEATINRADLGIQLDSFNYGGNPLSGWNTGGSQAPQNQQPPNHRQPPARGRTGRSPY